MWFNRPSAGQRAVLVLFTDDRRGAEELAGLARNAGNEIIARLWCGPRKPDVSHYLGSGKLAELATLVADSCADRVIVDAELSPAQERNLENRLGCGLMDRTHIILDIFAARARSHEGKLQVELAQLHHQRTRLVRGWSHLDRQRGGVHQRGPGEAQSEADRRMLNRRLHTVENSLSKIERSRALGRRRRHRSRVPVVALVGRTNAGKSTLFNCLSGGDAYVADKLFATLDTSLRRVQLPGGAAVISDTVGFIHRLPHTLIKAFHATLEEISGADLLIEVIDSGEPDLQRCCTDTEEVLSEIGAAKIPRMRVFNKADLLSLPTAAADRPALHVSARTGHGLAVLRQRISLHLFGESSECTVLIDPGEGRLRAELYRRTEVLEESMAGDGHLRIRLRAFDRDRAWLSELLKDTSSPDAHGGEILLY